MEKFWESFVLFRETSMLIRTLTTLSLAAMLIACGGGSSSSNNNNNGGGGGTVDDNGGVNGTYSGTFTSTTPAGSTFTVTALFTQGTAVGAPITGTATISPLSALPAAIQTCLGTAPLNVAGAEGNHGGLTMALINGPSTDGSKPKIDLPAPGSPNGEFPDVSGDKDTSFSGPFSIENCPATGDPSAMVGTGTLTRQ
jgi:hypothetical protein